MNAIEVIRGSLETSKGFAEALFRDMESDPFSRASQGEGHHAYWLLGHVIYGEAQGLDRYLLNRRNRYEKWASLFGPGSTPSTDAVGGLSYDELLEELDIVRAATLKHVATLTDSDLDRPCHPVEGGPSFETVGDCLIGIAIHMGIHAGQLADTRRAAGCTPVFF